MKQFILLLFILNPFLIKISSGQIIESEPRLKVFGTCKVDKGKMKGVKVSLLNKDSLIKYDNYNYQFFLEYDQLYSIKYEKEGYLSKKIDISTKNISIQRWNKGFIPIFINVVLYSSTSLPDSLIEKEVPMLKYFPQINDFDYNEQ